MEKEAGMNDNHLPEYLTGGGVIIGFSEFMNFLSWLGENADGLGILLSFIGVVGGLWLQYRRNEFMREQARREESNGD